MVDMVDTCEFVSYPVYHPCSSYRICLDRSIRLTINYRFCLNWFVVQNSADGNGKYCRDFRSRLMLRNQGPSKTKNRCKETQTENICSQLVPFHSFYCLSERAMENAVFCNVNKSIRKEELRSYGTKQLDNGRLRNIAQPLTFLTTLQERCFRFCSFRLTRVLTTSGRKQLAQTTWPKTASAHQRSQLRAHAGSEHLSSIVQTNLAEPKRL